ncbi:MAG: hypothetical protein CFE46_17825 [Burkholderiales bacterium PBB6]|nr:MAG: hypothetical protein CFE46_17825 [Burkholderiales bacterium PBB6]
MLNESRANSAASALNDGRMFIFPNEIWVKWLVVALFVKVSGLRFWSHGYLGQAYEPSRLVYYFEFAVTAATFALSFVNARVLWGSVLRAPVIAGFVVYALASAILVGEFQLNVLLYVLGYFECFAVLSLAVAIVGSQRLIDVLFRTAVVLLFANVAIAVVPSQSMMLGEFSGYYRGLSAHRNDLAYLAVICGCLVLCAPRNTSLICRSACLLTVIALLGAARSVQGIILFGLAAFIHFGAARTRLLKHPMVAVTAAFVVGLFAVVWYSFANLDDFLKFFGRDSTFTGRDRIWALSSYLLQFMPLEGYGYGRIGVNFISVGLLEKFRLGTLFTTAHNSYLEALLAYGWFGGGAFVLAVIWPSWRIISSVLSSPRRENTLAFALWLICIVGGITASEKLFLPTLGWFVFVLAQALRVEPRLEAVAGAKNG